MTSDNNQQTITVYVLTEDRTQLEGVEEITSCTTDSLLAERLIQESWYGTMRKVQLDYKQWTMIQTLLSDGEVVKYD